MIRNLLAAGWISLMLARIATADMATLKQRAEEGDPQAQNALGAIYYVGKNVPQDYAQAAYWYRKAAEQGNPNAQVTLGVMNLTGKGRPKDLAAAIRWFRMAAEQGDAQGEYYLGSMNEIGQGVKKDDAEAASWYRRAAEQGNVIAQNSLGALYRDGRGVKPDLAEAARWFRKAADQGNGVAQRNLGALYRDGRGVKKDPAEAARWFRKAADKGDASAQVQLGIAYHTGQGVPKDVAQAVYWYRKAAEQGNLQAQVNIGVCYHNGLGVSQDYAEAARWYQRAAQGGDLDCQRVLGEMYLAGQGVPQDEAIGLQWLQKASAGGNQAAKAKLAKNQQTTALAGRWEAFSGGRKTADCEIIQQGGQLEFVVRIPGRPEMRTKGRFLDTQTTRADGWKSGLARIQAGGGRLEWEDGAYWQRATATSVPASKGSQSGAAGESPPFTDEVAAMAAYEANPVEDRLDNLITIRAGHGMAMCAKSTEVGDPDLYKQGLSYMDSALDLASDNPRVYAMAGLCYAMAADEDDTAAQVATEYLEYALYLDETLVDAQLMLGSLYFDAGEYILSIEPLENSIQGMGAMVPADVVDALAAAYGKTCTVDQGLAFFTSMLESKGAKEPAHLGRAHLLWECKERGKAVDELQIILKDPQANRDYRNAAQQLALTWAVAQ